MEILLSIFIGMILVRIWDCYWEIEKIGKEEKCERRKKNESANFTQWSND